MPIETPDITTKKKWRLFFKDANGFFWYKSIAKRNIPPMKVLKNTISLLLKLIRLATSPFEPNISSEIINFMYDFEFSITASKYVLFFYRKEYII